MLLHPSLWLTSSFPIACWQPSPQTSPPAHGLSVVSLRLGDGLHLPPVPNSSLLQTQPAAPLLTPELLACPLRLPAQRNLQQHGALLRGPRKPAPEVPAPTWDHGAQGGSGNAPGWLGWAGLALLVCLQQNEDFCSSARRVALNEYPRHAAGWLSPPAALRSPKPHGAGFQWAQVCSALFFGGAGGG